MKRFTHELGKCLRETGQAMERNGLRVAHDPGPSPYLDHLSRHRQLLSLYDKSPTVAPCAFVAPSATLTGDVSVGEAASVWYSAMIKGDAGPVSIGAATNVQDRALVGGGATVGAGVTIGHGAKLLGCTVADDALIGMGSVVCPGATVERNGYVAAGAVVAEGTTVPSGEMWAGNPATFLRKLKPNEVEFFGKSSSEYSALAKTHAAAY